MQIVTFDETRVGSGMIFSSSVESQDWIGYHATSSYYSNDIDRNGFQQKKPLPVPDLERLVRIGQQHGRHVSDVHWFLQMKSLSFSPISEIALFYARPQSAGGQGLLHVKNLIDELMEKNASELDDADSTHLRSMLDTIMKIRAEAPVIYAVNVKGLAPIEFQKATKAIHVFCAVPPERVLAKMVVDKPVDYAGIDMKKYKRRLTDILQSPAIHYIKSIAS